MTVAHDLTHRGSSSQSANMVALEDRFEVLKEIGDGSFGSVALARVRSAGAHVARRGTVVAIKTMKKNFESFSACLELREVVFLRTLAPHAHLVPALDIFLDPYSKKLHIAMEYMEGNLYQLMKARDHKVLDNASVKSILFQIMQGLEHIHAHHFFHRDIKPENILVTTSGHQDSSVTSFRRYSALVTPPSTPPNYTVKIADFGLARETHSKLAYTTYVSTRWYRAPEVLLRAGEYSAPVDIWAIGAMAVEVATLKPLFPGGNEVDQVWRVCEIMGSPGNWYNKSGGRVGGGEWRHMLSHDYFIDAVDPLRPRSSASRILGRKQSDLGRGKDSTASTPTSSKPSWFRKSLIGRSETIDISTAQLAAKDSSAPRPAPVHASTTNEVPVTKTRPAAGKRSTWTNGPSNVAPMPILPTIRPISPLSDAVTAQASNGSYNDAYANGSHRAVQVEGKPAKVSRQLSVASSTNNYAEIHRQQAERALNGNSGLASPPSGQKEGFFSHLRKRARRFSGRHQTPISPTHESIEGQVGCGPWNSNRSSMVIDQSPPPPPKAETYESLDRALRDVQQHRELQAPVPPQHASPTNNLKRHHSLPKHSQPRSVDNLMMAARSGGPISSRTRRAQATQGVHQYEAPDEEDELLDEVLNSTHRAMKRMEKDGKPGLRQSASNIGISNPYPTPSPSGSGNAAAFGDGALTPKPLDLKKNRNAEYKWPTPPYEESEWAASASASIWAAGNRF
ncbi:hypothetical protein BN1708_009119 [Verticillium longisporum]|uniref:Protein kinase domain-containing protein n=1 Tax=Verticillium longisporum TaxID=100787 RepID=A0A0G4KE10_VERLO|nr:hypothetical protein BN1708_009119 [Verticillium longisporum]